MKHIDQNNSELVLALADKVLAPTYTRPEHLFVEGDGVFLKDAEGQQFLDMTSGVAVNALGHNAEIIKNALRKGLEGLIHTSNLFHTAPAILLANELVQHSFADKVFFTNSGAESVEGAIKFARLYAKDRHEIVYFDSSFHGRTLGALAATDKEKIRTPFTPLPTGYRCAPWNQHVAFNYITAQTAAVIVEPIQGEGGIRFADESWLQALRAHCDKVGALLIFDEVQCGLGRTGTLWGHQHYGITPDLMTLAKPLAGGLPMGAVLMTQNVADAITPSCHATTFGGGPLVATVAYEVFKEISNPTFLQAVQHKGAFLLETLRDLHSPYIEDIRGRGLFVGVQLNIPTQQVVEAARKEGLLLVAAANQVVRFVPSLTITKQELEQAVALFAKALHAVQSTDS
ncbi:MAG: acetylornithine aminotransferase [Deltaproteobacteria bacterium]|nr:acetylornithine aminotransferase [Deltaproteobacteria bacterium]|tara:strand:+ start:15773 stop:16972 length:1200 start_codon:yes stop_codon:yes gene_type:complete